MNATPWVWLLGLLTAASIGYYLAVLIAAARYRADCRRRSGGGQRPPVSILKPMRGAGPGLAENLRSHAELDYPVFELICGVADSDDPALAEIERLRAGYPKRPIRVLVCGPSAHGNPKVAILEKLAAEARHEILLVDDADIRLQRDALGRLVGELTSDVGLVTALYRARPGPGWSSRLDAMWISGDFAGQALTGAYLAGMGFALGAAMLFRKSDLERIGGFRAIRPYLADDYELGARIAALGKPVRLSAVVVETVLEDSSWKAVWNRHLRWSRTIRASRPGGHAGFLVTFGTVWGLLLLAAGGSVWLAASGFAGRMAAGFGAASALRAPRPQANAVGAPLVELWSAAVWLASLFGRRVTWSGRRLRLDRFGKIRREP